MSSRLAFAFLLFLGIFNGAHAGCLNPNSYPFADKCLDASDLNAAIGSRAPAVNPIFSGTFTGNYTLGGSGNANISQTIDPSVPGSSRFNNFVTTLSHSGTESALWQNYFSQLEFANGIITSAENNALQGNLQIDSGATIGGSTFTEGVEASLFNSGTISGTGIGLLSNVVNNSAGTANILFGAKAALSNANSAGGAITTYAAYDLEAMSGAGSLPTNYFFLRNADSNANVATAGNTALGTTGIVANVRLYVQGPDTSGSTFVLDVKNSTPSNILLLNDAGSLTVGLSGGSSVLTVHGTINANDTTTGTPAASLCLDGSGNIIKKTTTGSCV